MDNKDCIITHITKMLEEASEEKLRIIWMFVRAVLKPTEVS